jgi:integrase
MATLTHEPNGRWTIQVVCPDRKRRSIRLGAVAKRQADTFRSKISELETSHRLGQRPGSGSVEWLTALSPAMYSKLVGVGLAQARQETALEGFIEAFLQQKSIKASTLGFYAQSKKSLVDYFGACRDISTITEGEAMEWRASLKAKLDDNTIRRRTGAARHFLRMAVKKRLIPSNPFDGFPASVKGDESRMHYIKPEDFQALLPKCPDSQWRLILALARLGGLRCPSEILLLKWSDIDWIGGTFRVTSPKTEHHEGMGHRVVPLFVELRPFLEAAKAEAQPGDVYAVTRYRDAKQNLRTQFTKIINRAGLKPWPKLFQNLRSSRQTELSDTMPQHVVCKIMGNSQIVAKKHYLQVTEEHLRNAASVCVLKNQGSTPATNPVQNPVQKERESMENDGKHGEGAPAPPNEKPRDFTGFPKVSSPVSKPESSQVSHTGFEPVTSSMSRMRASQLRQWPISLRLSPKLAPHYTDSLFPYKSYAFSLPDQPLETNNGGL